MSTLEAPSKRIPLRSGLTFMSQHTVVISYTMMVLLFVVAQILIPGFDTYNHISLLLSEATVLGVVAAGQTLVILTGGGGIDLSVAGGISLAGVTFTGISNGADSGFAQAMAVVLGVGLLVGLANGIGISMLRLPPLVMTLGMGGILSGVTLVSTNGTPSGSAPPLAVTLATGTTVFNLPIAVLIWAVLALVLIVVLRRTVFGRQVTALGTSAPVAILSGVNPRAILLTAYALSGVFAAFAGVILTGQNGTAGTTAGSDYLLPSVAAVVVGGSSILGGRGGYGGTIAGAIIITVLQAILQAEGITQDGQDILYGVVILIVLFIYGREAARRA
jgi:ribose transport system permease protein